MIHTLWKLHGNDLRTPISYIGDKEILRQAMGMPEDYDVDLANGVGGPAYMNTGLQDTEDPRVYRFRRNPMRADAMYLAVRNAHRLGNDRWLKEGVDYVYSEKKGEIILLSDSLFDPEAGESLFVSAVPRQDLFFFHKSLDQGSVEITLNDRSLKEGEEFVVDYGKGIVKVLIPEINDMHAKYEVRGAGAGRHHKRLH